MNRPFDLELAREVDQIFTEVLVAPSFSEEALALLRKKKNRRLLRVNFERIDRTELTSKRVFGGLLIQEPDLAMEDVATARAVTSRKPSEATAVVQPGGSMRDDEVIAVADRLGIAMVLTGVRHFRH